MRNKQFHFKSLLLATVFAISGVAAWAQSGTVTGRVKSRGEDLAGATVQVEGNRTVTTTNGDGQFTLSLPAGSYSLLVTYAGMQAAKKSITVKANALTEVDVEMEPAKNTENVTVVGSRSSAPRSMISTPAPVDVFTARELMANAAFCGPLVQQQPANHCRWYRPY
jgi:CarboxypepD_reg-like domain